MITPVARALLQLSLVRGVGPARLRRALAIAVRDGGDLDAMASILTPEQRDQLVGEVDAAARWIETLAREGAQVVCAADAAYPRALVAHGDVAAPLLMVRGMMSLLARPAVGFCGSRAASPRGLEVATDCADQLARVGVVVVSGHAAGVDTAAHVAALRAGGATVLVLAEGVLRFQRRTELAEVWDDDRACVVSEFAPTAVWSAGQAMQRNRTIVGLSEAMILIEAGATGGSIAAGREALRLGVPLFAPEYEGMPATATGNRELLREGARPLLRARATMRANLDGVLAINRSPASTADARQLALLG